MAISRKDSFTLQALQLTDALLVWLSFWLGGEVRGWLGIGTTEEELWQSMNWVLYIAVPFTPGRGDASPEMTDVESFAYLEPKSDGFRNFAGKGNPLPAEYMLIDRANLLTLTVPEMTGLVGGLRVLGANFKDSKLGVFTDKPGRLTNDYFVNLLDMDTEWSPSSKDDETYVGKDRSTGKQKWIGSRVDLIFGSNSQLRAVAEVYAEDDAKEKFARDFAAAFSKVMDLDRFDVKK